MNQSHRANADWAEVRALFGRVLGLDEQARAAALADPAIDAAVRAEVASLLDHDAQAATGFLQAGVPPGATTAAAARPASRIGQRLGAWRLVRLLGSGGMGEVFEARRDDGRFQGEAAVKLLKRGMDSQAVLARFAHEQQALARLSHAHIARLLDAGITDDGLPYFVMERVQGRAIDVACEGRPLEQRLALFLQLADAVAHAHRNLLVHRDLKPSNVLVDDEGQVRLLDFGIAKALDAQGDGSGAGTTHLGERPFTPQYASPEQVRGDSVSTATDVYSLGVLLYVLLTGQRPYGRGATTAAEAARAVLEEDPTRPSELLAASGQRQRRALLGELDNIVLKALAKLPAERYTSVDALAADITAYLQGRPVSARAASPGYVLAKWLQRHRAVAAAAAVGGLGLLSGLAATVLQGRTSLALGVLGMGIGLVLALLQARRAQRARDEAARARDEATRHLSELRTLANRMVFEVNDALERGLTEGRRQLVHVAAQSLQRQADIGALTDAERLDLGQALARLARLEGQDNTPNLGNVHGALAQYERALQVLQPLAKRQQDNAEWHGAMSSTLEGRAEVMRTLRQGREGVLSIQRAAEHAQRAAALAPHDMRWALAECTTRVKLADHRYGVVRIHAMRELDGALADTAEAVRCGERLVAAHPADFRAWRARAHSLRLHSGMLGVQGRLGEAVATERKAFDALNRAMTLPGSEGVLETDYIAATIRLGITLRAAGLHDEGAAVLARTVERAERGLLSNASDAHVRATYYSPVQTLLDLHLHRGDAAAAAAVHARAVELLPPLPEDDPLGKWQWQQSWMDSLHVLACVRLGRVDEAAPLAERLQRWAREGRMRLHESPRALDAELEANIHIASAYALAAMGDVAGAGQAAQAACERLDAMRTLRDPRDAIEIHRDWQLTVRLAQAPFGEDAAGTSLRARLVARARAMQAELIERGIVEPADHAEARWLAALAP